MKCLIVTVQYFQHDKTLQLINSIFNDTSLNQNHKVVVVDNAFYSANKVDMHAMLLSFYEHLIYVPNKNEGYFPGLNTGIVRVENIDEYDFIIACNNDIVFSKDFFHELSTYLYLSEEDVCLVPNIIGLSGEQQNPQYSHKISLVKRVALTLIFSLPIRLGYKIHSSMHRLFGRKIMQARNVTNYDKDGLAQIYLPLGAIFIFTPRLYKKIGGLPKDSFLYGEEMLFRKALIKAYGTFKISKNLNVLHSESSTTSILSSFEKWKMQRRAFYKYMWFYLLGR